MSSSTFMDVVRSRASVRNYDPRPVPLDAILSAVEAAHLAPSAQNTQPWRFVVVRDPASLERLGRAAFSGIHFPSRFAARAPVIVALCASRARLIQVRAPYQLDCGIAGEHLVLRAAELGLATCWIGWFNKRLTRKALGAPPLVDVVALISMGYPAAPVTQRRRVRRPLSSMVWLDRWGNGYPGSEK